MKASTRVFLILALCLLPISVSAAYFKADDQVSVSQPTDGDVYVAGETVTVSETVNGDVFAAGGSVNIIKDVSEDLFAVGSSVNVTGNVTDDLRVAGSNVVINGDVGDELFAAGSLVQITSAIVGDAHAAGTAVILDGMVGGNLYLGSSSAIINGQIAGNVVAYSEEIKIGPNAKITGTLTYYAQTEMDFTGVDVGKVVYGGSGYEPREKDANAWMTGFASAAIAIKLLGILVAGLLIGLIWPKTAISVIERASTKFWKSLLIGFATVVLVPIATVLLFVSLIGWPIAVALVAASFLLCMVTTAYMGVVVGCVTMKLIKKQQTIPTPKWYIVLLGVAIIAVLALIPAIGWFAIFLIYLSTLGAVVKLKYEQMKLVH